MEKQVLVDRINLHFIERFVIILSITAQALKAMNQRTALEVKIKEHTIFSVVGSCKEEF